jgi:hypothetical protein
MGGFKISQNGSKFDMQLFFMYMKRYRGREEIIENFFLKTAPPSAHVLWGNNIGRQAGEFFGSEAKSLLR